MDTAASRPRSLGFLLEEVHLAREALHQERIPASTQAGVRAAQIALCGALSAYQNALVARRLPIPPAMHDELNLYRRVIRS